MVEIRHPVRPGGQDEGSDTASPPQPATEEDALRAAAWRLFARYLSSPPSSGDLEVAAGMTGDDSAFGRAIAAFAAIAAGITAQEAEDEYDRLFIGVTRGELVPYASYYLTGFLNEKPLARLREDMARLGIVRDPSVRDPEDHIAALCDIMAGLIGNEFAVSAGLAEQREFFERHIDGWADYFFRDLEAAESAHLYAPLAAAGRAFMAIEREAFAMAGESPK